jgi:hypothetical protein
MVVLKRAGHLPSLGSARRAPCAAQANMLGIQERGWKAFHARHASITAQLVLGLHFCVPCRASSVIVGG